MGRIIEAKAVISAEDRTGKAFDAIARKFREVGKGAKASVEVGRLAKQIDAANAGLRNIEKFRTTQQAFGAARANYRATQLEVGRVAKELDAARAAAKAFDGIRSFSKSGGIAGEIAAAKKQVVELERQFNTAQRAVKAAAAGYESHATALKGAKRDYEASGASIGKLVSDQARLKAAIEGTNAAILKQEQHLRAESRLSGGLGGAGRSALPGIERRDASARASRLMVDGMGAPGRAARASAEHAAAERQQLLLDQRQSRLDAAKTLGGMGGLYLGHKVKEGTQATLHTYREFDKERRFGKAVMGLTDEEQKPLIDQAIHLGANTKYNDVQVLESQRELAARGLKKDQVMGMIDPATDLGQSFDLRLPEAVKQMEGAIFGFQKPIATLEEAMKSARQTADVQVKAAKISGMTPEDITQTYKYGATPARMAGLSEQSLLAFAGISKKANMGGDEAGTAFRALVANMMSPTRKAKEAMLANGMDYKNYQKAPQSIDTDAFTKTVAAQYGVKLKKGVQDSLRAIFTDKALIADPSKFTPAVTKLLRESLGGDDAKSKKSIAGLAGRFRDASMKGVDADKLMADLMTAIPKNPALANAIFGSKQGARIQNALGNPETFKKMIGELIHGSDGYAKKISQERMAGYDGAMSRFEGAQKNLESRAGSAWDNEGRGGFLTGLIDAAGKATQALAELPQSVLAIGSAAAWLTGKIATGAGTLALLGAALKLNGSAAALTAAAGRLGVGGLPGGSVPPVVPAAVAGGTLLGPAAVAAGVAVGGAVATVIAKNAVQDEAFADPYLQGGILGADPAGYGLGAAIVHADKLPGSQATRAVPSMLGPGHATGPMPGIGTGGFGLGGAQAGQASPLPAAPLLDAEILEAARAKVAALKTELAGVSKELAGLQASGEGAFSPETSGLEARKAELDALIQKAETYQRTLKGADASGQVAAVNNTLDKATTASSTAANGGKPIEATVKPDQITAKIESLPPVTGEANVNVESKLNVAVTLNEPMLQAKIDSSVGRATAKMNLSSSGARPGAVSMPGAASTPGAQ